MIERTPEQVEDHRSVWEQMRAKYPEFTRAHDSLDNYHGVREIVLGGSTSWGGAHKRFQPFPDIKSNPNI